MSETTVSNTTYEQMIGRIKLDQPGGLESRGVSVANQQIVSRPSTYRSGRPIRVAMVPLMFELYDRLSPELRGRLQEFFLRVCDEMRIINVCFEACEMVSSGSQMKRVCDELSLRDIDLIVAVHLCYSPSGQMASGLMESRLPLLLWPAQPMERIDTDTFDVGDVFLNHGVHGTMDLANVLRRGGRGYGVVHGNWRGATLQRDLLEWAQVGCMLQSMRGANPLVLGGRFPDMLDLRLEDEPFMQELGICPRDIPLDDFAQTAGSINASAVLELFERYQDKYEIAPSLDESLLLSTARNELALRELLQTHQSRAVAVNFLDMCARPDIADPLHVAVSNLMAEGVGYGAEADWETAVLISGLQAALGHDCVGFTEVFSVDYGGNRLLLRHWGEGNTAQAEGKPRLIRSELNDGNKVVFSTCDFQYRPGECSLLNMSATPDGQGQLILVRGTVEDTRLRECDGVKALFTPQSFEVEDLLNEYAMLGGSHHLALIEGDASRFAKKLARQTGWQYHELP